MNDIVHQIPWQLSNFGGSGVGGSYNLQDYQFDYALGGIPFLSATRDAWPYTEGMAEIRKQQFDSFAEPGEQSISGNFWWLRSQSNFSGGAGIIYQDPDTDNQFDVRFADSLGVDPWTSGELKLLRQPDNRFTVTSSFTRTVGYVDPSGVDSAWYTDGGIFWKITSAGRTGITNPSAGTQFDLAGTGTRYFILASDGIWSGIDTAAATQMYTPPGGTLTSGAIAFVKGRIAAAFNNTIYFAPINTGGPIAIPTTSSFTHTDPNWVWTSITEGPTAIYAAGRNSTSSAIHKFTIDFSGTTEIVLPTITAVTPTGERINSIFGYIGSFMGIATTKGFRVGEFDSNGDVVYGPLLFTPTGGCQGITGFDRFMWTGSTAAHDGSSGLYRVDLGNTIQEQTTKAVRYAYARDLYASGQTNSIQSVTMLGASDRKVFTITSSSVWSENATTLYPTGYLKTGRIRFNTEEPKLYKFVSLRTPIPLKGGVGFSVIDKSGAETPYVTYGPSFSPGTGDIATPQPNGPQIWVALRFTLTRGTDITTGGVLNGWQYKALPGSIRQRLINQTFLLFDEEMDKGGQRVGTDGYARSRFEDFKALARAGDVVVFQELIEDISTLVVIDDWKYTQTGPPGPNASSLGGYLTVVLRTVAEST